MTLVTTSISSRGTDIASREETMPEPQQGDNASSDTNRSGARRITEDVRVDEELPPTPAVLVQRPRIVTGRYSVVRPGPRK